ncbi:beta-galactosidase [Actinoplanes sp. RD1]|uniref:beta-galactosidase n=1 Tax=Actinoplanes sp. RD1 TaxID=3064538 RepID=UPI002741F6E5|nr:beta-galactosidase [Actinoplanes sp. RD1]
MKSKIAAVAAAALALASFVPSAARAASATPATAPSLGIIGNYSDADMTSMHSAGSAADALVEMEWAKAEPVRGQYDERYLDSVAARIAGLKALGYTISFNTGVQNAPAWLLALPGARYVDQNGETYADSDEPNLVFGTQYRPLATRYLKKVFARLGTGFSIVRVGGGHWGELTYPFKLDPATGKLRNLYYAFDINARLSNPAPQWKPGQPSPKGQAGRFLKWYLNSLAAYQNWQIAALRQAGFAGTAAVLYPSYGMRSGDFDKAVATNLAGTSSPEINGEVQRGYDATRQVAALKDPKVVVYGTWAENANTVAYLAGLARGKGLRAMAETSHVCLPAQLPAVMAQAQQNDLATLYIVRLAATDIIGSSRYLAAAR